MMAETKAVAAAVEASPVEVEEGRSKTVAAAVEASPAPVEKGRSKTAAAEVEAGPAEVEEGRSKTVVLVAVDDSDASYRALEWAVRHVAATAGMAGAGAVELVVLHAKPPTSLAVNMGGPGVPGDVVGLVEEDLRKKAEGVVGKARSLCAANSVEAVVDVVDGEPKHVLCDAVEKHHADLLVVGSQGYGAIRRSLIFSFPAVYAFTARLKLMVAVSCLNSSFLQGIAWERERLLRTPCRLLCGDCQAARVQELIAISGVGSIVPSSSVGILLFACLHNVSLLNYFCSN
uniref:UspA domain-containing protein n=2 Tax=Aegilops tauschii subsp. strangulata TaxID=200361 RepID=A0A453AQA1_AEGTS